VRTRVLPDLGQLAIAWLVPLNGHYNPVSDLVGFGIEFPGYFLAVFLLPLIYGAWRFVTFHLVAGPLLGKRPA